METMEILQGFRARHVEIRDMIGDLQLLLQPDQLRIRPNAKTAYRLLCELSDVLKQHLAEEDRGLYPSLLVHEDNRVKSMAWGFISGERPLRRLFDDYRKRWLAECDFTFSNEFLSETVDILDLVEQRIQREESLLFPKLEEIGRLKNRNTAGLRGPAG
jgi:hemerythrin-like domain-containing protein